MSGQEQMDTSQGKKYRIVAIAMDGSDSAKHALHWYINNIFRENDKVVLLHAVELPGGMKSLDDDVKLTATQVTEKQQILHKVDQYRKLLEDEKICTPYEIVGDVKVINSKRPEEGIIQGMNEVGAHLVVTGCRGLGTIRRTILGSVSDYVLHHSNVPVAICH